MYLSVSLQSSVHLLLFPGSLWNAARKREREKDSDGKDRQNEEAVCVYIRVLL